MILCSLLAFKLYGWTYDLYKTLAALEKIFKCMCNEFHYAKVCIFILFLGTLNLMFFQTWPILLYYQLLHYYYYLFACYGSNFCDLSTTRFLSVLPKLSGPLPVLPHVLTQPTLFLLLFAITGLPLALLLWGNPKTTLLQFSVLLWASPPGSSFLPVCRHAPSLVFNPLSSHPRPFITSTDNLRHLAPIVLYTCAQY